MNFSCEEQIGGFNNVSIFTMAEVSGWPLKITDHNSNAINFTPVDTDVTGTILEDSIKVTEKQNKKEPGMLFDVDIEFEFTSQTPAMDQLLDKYRASPGGVVAVVCKYWPQKRLYGSKTFPLFLEYSNGNGRKPEDGSATIVKLSGKSKQRSVHILEPISPTP